MGEAIGGVAQVDAQTVGDHVQLGHVLHPLVACRTGDHQVSVGIAETAHELDGELDALAWHDPRGLHEEPVVRPHAELGAHGA